MRGPWRPILEGQHADEARAAAVALASCLERSFLASMRNPDLPGGLAGLAVFFAYLAATGHGRRYDRLSVETLRRAVDLVPETTLTPALHGGFSGIAWAVEHLSDEDHNEDIDEALIASLTDHEGRSPWHRRFDAIRGIAGVGVYALERLPRPAAAPCLVRLIGILEATAVREPDGTVWWETPNGMSVAHGELEPRSGNLGVAHGVPGVIGFLSEAHAAGIATERVQPLLTAAVRWVLAQRLPLGEASCFSTHAGERAGARSAWCYGDPGIALVLLNAARRTNEPAWEREAIEIALRAASRPPSEAGVNDAGLCHGAAGLGHVFNRLHQATREPLLRDAARFWLARALAMRRPGQGVAGFTAWSVGGNGETGWHDDPGLLMGGAGIGLAFLAAVTPVEPLWDRILLASIPPKSD